jgi:pyruvate ferredoxin oxidoreductase gamma subunit
MQEMGRARRNPQTLVCLVDLNGRQDKAMSKVGNSERRKQSMPEMIEIRWHGRGGQGAKTAAQLLAEAAMDTGKYIQAFPEYGPERAGAPMRSYNRISPDPIRIHSAVTDPGYVVVIDPTLLVGVDVAEGLGENGALLVNTSMTPGQVRERIGLKHARVYTVDASAISMQLLGKNMPNTPMLGALAKVGGFLAIEDLKSKLHHKFDKKLGAEGAEANIRALERAASEVKGE